MVVTMKSETGGAVFDRSRAYRYLLWRTLENSVQSSDANLLVVMLNPNTADAERNDPTIRRCISFAQSWGFSRLEVVNLFAVKTPNPAQLKGFKDAIGKENDRFILEAAEKAGRIVVAWGNHGRMDERDREVTSLLRSAAKTSVQLLCFGTTKFGNPRHPLYVRSDFEPCAFSG